MWNFFIQKIYSHISCVLKIIFKLRKLKIMKVTPVCHRKVGNETPFSVEKHRP